MSTIKRVIIHAGMPKTGTSSIQEALFHNSSLLRANNFIYLSEWGENHNMEMYNLISPTFDSRYRKNKLKGLTEENWQDYNDRNLEVLQNVVEQNSCENLILSSENIYGRKSEVIHHIKKTFSDLFPDAQVSVFVCVRSPLSFLRSYYQQNIISPTNVDPEAPILSWAQSLFKTNLTYFKDVFADELTVFEFEQAITDPGGLVAYFLKSIGCPPNLISSIRPLHSNDSKSMEAVEFLRSLKDTCPLVHENEGVTSRNPLRTESDINVIMGVAGAKFELPSAFRKQLYDMTKPDALWLKETFGIDYTEAPLTDSRTQNGYSDETLKQFLSSFKYLTRPLQTHFLNFFEQKYQETNDDRFKALFFKGSEPWKIYQIDQLEPYLDDVSKVSGKVYNWGIKRPMLRDRVLVTLKGSTVSKSQTKQVFKYLTPPNGYIEISESFAQEDNYYEININLSMYSCIVTIPHLLVNEKTNSFRIDENEYDEKIGTTYLFNHDNPHFTITTKDPIVSLEMELIIDTGSFTSSRLNTALSNKREVIYQKELSSVQRALKEWRIKEETLVNLVDEHNKLCKEYETLKKEHSKLLNSKSWKITKPLRNVYKAMKGTK